MSKLLLIQILRAVAAFFVVMLHAQHDTALLMGREGISFRPLTQFAFAAGVDMFFVISGFIMVYASENLFARPGARRIFLAHRIARIVPLYWAVTTLYLGLVLFAPNLLNAPVIGIWPILASYFFIPFTRPDGLAQPVYSLGWTLNFEMLFYALFAFVIPWKRSVAVGVLGGILVALALAGSVGDLPQPLAFWTSYIVLEFAFGLAIGQARAQGLILPRFLRIFMVLVGFGLLGLGFEMPDGMTTSGRVLYWGLPSALIVAGAALGPESREARSKLALFAVSIGDASYALYLLHPFVIRGLAYWVAAFGLAPVLGAWGFIFLSLCAVLVISLAVHQWLERPLVSWVRRKLSPG